MKKYMNKFVSPIKVSEKLSFLLPFCTTNMRALTGNMMLAEVSVKLNLLLFECC